MFTMNNCFIQIKSTFGKSFCYIIFAFIYIASRTNIIQSNIAFNIKFLLNRLFIQNNLYIDLVQGIIDHVANKGSVFRPFRGLSTFIGCCKVTSCRHVLVCIPSLVTRPHAINQPTRLCVSVSTDKLQLSDIHTCKFGDVLEFSSSRRSNFP